MTSALTHEIEISVSAEYQPEFSNPKGGVFLFSYNIRIENHSGYTVQLLRRYWHISDSNGIRREVEGDGVVGLQPVLEPGESHEYSSACNLETDMGKMYGEYEFVRLIDGQKLMVSIPEFKMVSPFRLN